MANITLRESTSLTSPGATVKGSPLTNNEVDNNFSNINIEHGVLSALTTGVKSNLVFAVNELKSNIGIGVSSVAGGTGSVSNNIILAGLLTVDGVGSTLDADTLDGLAGGGSGLYALKANNLSVFASTTSAQLAGIISDETGSGSLVFSASPTLTGNITVTGNINVSLDGVFTGNVSANDFISTSDRRLKENIETLEDPFLVLNQLEPVSYNWTLTGQKGFGLIAQEVESVLPEIVSNNGEYKGISYINIIAFLIQAVKKLNKEVQTLKNSRG